MKLKSIGIISLILIIPAGCTSGSEKEITVINGENAGFTGRYSFFEEDDDIYFVTGYMYPKDYEIIQTVYDFEGRSVEEVQEDGKSEKIYQVTLKVVPGSPCSTKTCRTVKISEEDLAYYQKEKPELAVSLTLENGSVVHVELEYTDRVSERIDN